MRNSFWKYLPMDIGRLVCWPLLIGYRHRRIHVSGEPYKEKLKKGGVIIAANHVDFGDPFVLGSCFWYRRMYFLTAKEVMATKLRARLLTGIGCIRIDREASDIDAISKCVDVLKEGKCLSVFPQGGLHRDGEVGTIKSGVVLIAVRAGVPIVPVYSTTRKHWWQRRTEVIGDPIDYRDYCAKRFPSMAELERVAEILQEQLEACEKRYEQL